MVAEKIVGIRLVRFLSWVLLSGAVTLALTACPKKQMVKKEEEQKPPVEDVLSEELDIHDKEFAADKQLDTIYFEFDSSDLSTHARNVLAQNAVYLKQHENLEILSEGHCDDRGTIAYNLTLGQKRAASVRNYYVSLGLDAKRVGAVSFGKEKPGCLESTEDCWAKNRRVETKVRNLAPVKKVEQKETPAEIPAPAALAQ